MRDLTRRHFTQAGSSFGTPPLTLHLARSLTTYTIIRLIYSITICVAQLDTMNSFSLLLTCFRHFLSFDDCVLLQSDTKTVQCQRTASHIKHNTIKARVITCFMKNNIFFSTMSSITLILSTCFIKDTDVFFVTKFYSISFSIISYLVPWSCQAWCGLLRTITLFFLHSLVMIYSSLFISELWTVLWYLITTTMSNTRHSAQQNLLLILQQIF
jgi:hypothetical protein